MDRRQEGGDVTVAKCSFAPHPKSLSRPATMAIISNYPSSIERSVRCHRSIKKGVAHLVANAKHRTKNFVQCTNVSFATNSSTRLRLDAKPSTMMTTNRVPKRPWMHCQKDCSAPCRQRSSSSALYHQSYSIVHDDRRDGENLTSCHRHSKLTSIIMLAAQRCPYTTTH